MTFIRTEIKIYDIKTGQLEKIHYNMIEQSKKQEITMFRLDKKYRKCYVTDNDVIMEVNDI